MPCVQSRVRAGLSGIVLEVSAILNPTGLRGKPKHSMGAESDILTNIRVAEGHLWVVCATDTGPARGCQIQQQQDAGGQGFKGGHDGFWRGGEEGSGGLPPSRSDPGNWAGLSLHPAAPPSSMDGH